MCSERAEQAQDEDMQHKYRKKDSSGGGRVLVIVAAAVITKVVDLQHSKK
jgi:hypothetical protein